MARHAGLMIPLFSAWSGSSWGIGEFPDLVPLAAWAASGRFDRLMLLPFGTLPERVTSPYSAMTAMAIDPNYIAIDAVEDFARAGGTAALSEVARIDLERARRSPRVRYEDVRRVKREALDIAFRRFMDDEWSALTLRAASLAGYIARERWWLDDYAIYASLVRFTDQPSWRQWPSVLRDRDPAALDEIRRLLAREILQQQYWQWLAESQWQEARRAARAHGVTVVGDLPFMVSGDSPDVWTRPGEYLFDVSLGVPPDAFSETGQDWDLPTYRWDAIAATGYAWIAARARRMAALFDGYRVDHTVGLYRTYGRPRDGAPPFFNPPGEAAALAQGEQVLRLLLGSGATILAEDLGVVPDFVRESLASLGIAGTKVLRWERRWHEPGQPFVDPRTYPPASVAMTGTHDTETMGGWWESASGHERQAAAAMVAAVSGGSAIDPAAGWSAAVRDALLAAVYRSGSDEMVLPVPDVFGWRDRLNTPGTIGDENWTWRLPWAVDRLAVTPEASARADFCARTAASTGR